MPDGYIPNEGLPDTLADLIKNPPGASISWQLLLWVNDLYTPGKNVTLADLHEPTWSGYSRVNLTRSQWTTPVVDDVCCKSTWGTQPYAWTVGSITLERVHGWAMLDITTGRLRYVQKFDDDDVFAVQPGSVWRMLPTYTLTSAACPPPPPV